MTERSDLASELRGVCARAASLTTDTELAGVVRAARVRLDSPLRVAIAGRVKAGKSTLLNALVGERLAPTDAGECTRLVTVYRHGLNYDVSAACDDGSRRPVPFRRDDGVLELDLAGLDPSRVTQLEVVWPSATLADTTLIDTPGLASLAGATSARSEEFLAGADTTMPDADAVIYLMRHVHPRDAEFLAAFTDPAVGARSPVSAVAVVSRADEIGNGRLDAMRAAREVASRYAQDERIVELCQTVVPVAGLLAETALTLRESEVAALRQVAQAPEDVLDAMLLSADRFRDPARTTVAPEVTAALLSRLGMFGLRYALNLMRANMAVSATDLSASLLAVSGLPELRRVIDEHFSRHSHVLKARAALTALHHVAGELTARGAAAGAELAYELERLDATTLEFAALRLRELVVTRRVELSDDETAEVLDLTGGEPSGTIDETIAAVERWRTRAANPFADRETADAAATVARLYESRATALRMSESR